MPLTTHDLNAMFSDGSDAAALFQWREVRAPPRRPHWRCACAPLPRPCAQVPEMRGLEMMQRHEGVYVTLCDYFQARAHAVPGRVSPAIAAIRAARIPRTARPSSPTRSRRTSLSSMC